MQAHAQRPELPNGFQERVVEESVRERVVEESVRERVTDV